MGELGFDVMDRRLNDVDDDDLGPLANFPPSDAAAAYADHILLQAAADPAAGRGGGGGGGAAGIARMPSFPTDARFFDENDLMHLDGMLDFDIDPRDPALPIGTLNMAATTTTTTGTTAGGLTSSEDLGDSSGQGGAMSPVNTPKNDDPHGIADLDPNDPKYKRRIQNRLASARFRAKAKERWGGAR